MAKNGNKDVVELWGREFDLAKNGLNEAQIVPFVNELIGERDQLVQSMEHLSSLTKLAEKTIVEADRLAEEIKKEAIDQTKTEATAIMAKAEEQAQQLLEEKRTEAITIATEEAEAIRANAEHETGLLLERQNERMQSEVKAIAQRLYTELLSQLESLKQQAIALGAEFERKLSQPAEQASPVVIEKEQPPAQVSANIQQESNIIPGSNLEVSPQGAEDIPAESQQLSQTIDQTNTSEVEGKVPLAADSQDELTYENEVELEIQPPIDVKQIMGIMRALDSLGEVENTELIPLTDKPLIVVFLHEPMHLMKILRALPEVDEAKEVTGGEITAVTDAAHAEGKRRKIQITLSGNSGLDEAKSKLNSEVYHTLPL